MLVLKNIRKTADGIEAYFYPENGDERGYVYINADGSCNYEKSDIKRFPVSAVHAIDTLKKMLTRETIPAEKIVMWY